MPTPPEPPSWSEAPALVADVAQGLGRLARDHLALLRTELREEIGQAGAGAGAIAAGTACLVTGGALATLATVHALHRATRLPLWACYGLVAGSLGAGGVALLAHGRNTLAGLRLAPQSNRALQDSLAWARQQIAPPEPDCTP